MRMLSIFKIKSAYLIIPALLAVAASFFEVASIGLIIPTVKGIIEGDFSFVREFPILGDIILWLPDKIEGRNATIFIMLVSMVFLSTILKNVFQYASLLGTVLQVRWFANNMRKKIYERYLSFSKTYFDHTSIGYLHQILVGHTGQIALQMKTLQHSFFYFF